MAGRVDVNVLVPIGVLFGKDEDPMKKAYLASCFLLLAFASVAAAQGHNGHSIVRWKTIVGVITSVNVNNPVGDIASGTFPWSATSGRARVDLSTGFVSFDVEGLVINGSTFSGTPGPITEVTGTLVCNPGGRGQAVLDTAAIHLDQEGDAQFSGYLDNVPDSCTNPLFLIRIATPAGAAGRWIATGAERSSSR
jgi:hypothetical protein